jgi:murein DD-endopeptidase MepM/ murein hydrolase activator NlpD
MFKSLFFLSFFVYSFTIVGQKNDQQNYHPPLDIPLVLAANFGELRPNHFHMGVDFKTNGAEGLKLYAIEEGFVSRIKISPYGYGKAVYIDHPNGITSVYAHCSSLIGRLDSLTKLTQTKEENFEVDIYFTPKDLPVKRGEVIALSGNTGGSTAPHLHFELRDTKTEMGLNPLVYGFQVADTKAPEIKGLKVYAVTNDGYQIPNKSFTKTVTKGKFGFYIGGDLLQVPSDYCSVHGGIGFAFEVVDYFDGAPNVCGLYSSSIRVGKDTLFQQRINQISFENSRYVNNHKDFKEYSLAKRKFHKSFRTKHNPLEIYPTRNLGVLHISPRDSFPIAFKALDTKNNTAELKFTLKVSEGPMNTSQTIFPSWKYFHPDSSYHIKSEQVEFYIAHHTFYEPTLKNLSTKGTISLGDASQPIQFPISVKLPIKKGLTNLSTYYIAVTTAGGKVRPLKTSFEGNWISAKSSHLGTFQIKRDTIAPSLIPLNFTGNEAEITKTRLTWKVKENQTELIDYDLFIDGKWQVLEYESKGDYVFFDRPKGMLGKHKLELIVVDSCGNKQVWTKELFFK